VNMLYVLIPLALLLLACAIWAFVWASRSGQFDDLDSPAWDVILDDDKAPDGATKDNLNDDEPR